MRDELLARLGELGDRAAVIDGDTPYSYGDLADLIRQLGRTLESRPVRPHDAVILNGDFSFRSIAALFALYRNRNVIIPVVALTEATRRTITASCSPRHLIRVGDDLEIEGIPDAPPASAGLYDRLIDNGTSGLVLLSSGSTGVPKAILHDFDTIVAQQLGRAARPRGRTSGVLMFLLFDHIGGLNSLLGALRAGGTAILPRRRTPEEICALIERHGIALLPTSPTFLNLILIGRYHQQYDLSSLRLITYGTEPMPPELLTRVNTAFPQARLRQTFGTSETGISATTSESSRSTYFKIADENVQYRIVDGELQLKSSTQFLGYLNYPNDALTGDAWFRTGDLVEENADGFITVKGRATEVINVGGEKVLPLELESILLSSPLIDDCVVYGRPNAITGQSVCADIKPRGDLTRAELRRHVAEFLSGQVAEFKVPARINLIDSVTVSERFKKQRTQP
jgi:acyl-CoA synthetase (AMP-forming)/AMP-acid ligase II